MSRSARPRRSHSDRPLFCTEGVYRGDLRATSRRLFESKETAPLSRDRRDGRSRRLIERADQSLSREMTSPPDRVPRAQRVGVETVSLRNLTEPSAISTFTT